jgi:hypothetical protein
MSIVLDSESFNMIVNAAQPLQPWQRAGFLNDVAEALRREPAIGPGATHRVIREAQKKHFDPPADTRSGTPARHADRRPHRAA